MLVPGSTAIFLLQNDNSTSKQIKYAEKRYLYSDARARS
jgi:hypothetical protein